jgi:hypothetical protein
MRQKIHPSKQDISTAGREIAPSSYFPNLSFIYILDFLKNKFRCSLVLPYFFPPVPFAPVSTAQLAVHPVLKSLPNLGSIVINDPLNIT